MELNFSTVASVLVFFMFGYLGYYMFSKKLTVRDMLFSGNVVAKFELAAIISTLIEVVSLTIIATERGVPFASASMRFFMVGVLEVIASSFFIEQYSSGLKDIVKDGKVTTLENFFLFCRTTPFLVAAIMVTHFIGILYLESLGVITASPTGQIFGPLFSVEVSQEVLSAMPGASVGGIGVIAGASKVGKLELSALFIIYNTVILIFGVLVLNYKAEMKKMKDKKGINKDKTSKDPKTPSSKPSLSDSQKAKSEQILNAVKANMGKI